MKLRSFVAAGLGLMLSTAAMAQSVQTVNLGVFTATGPGAAGIAEGTSVGAQYVFDAFNKRDPKFQIKRVDINIGAYDPATGMNSFRKAISVDNVLAFIAAGSPLILAARPLVEQNKVVLFSIAGADAVIKENNYVQQVMPFWADEAAVMGRYLCKTGVPGKPIKRVGVIAVGGGGGDSAVNAVKKWASLCPVEIVDVQRYSIPTTNFKPQLTALAQAKPDAIYIASLGGAENTSIVSQARQLGIASILISPLAGPESSLFDVDGSDGFLYTSYALKDLPPEIEAAYKKLGAATLFGYYYGVAATQVIDDLRKANQPVDRDHFRDALLKRRVFVIAGNPVCFEPDGHTKIPLAIWRIKNKAPEQLANVPDPDCHL